MIKKMADNKTISMDDMHLVLLTDDVNEAKQHIKSYIKKNYFVKRIKPNILLNEKAFD